MQERQINSTTFGMEELPKGFNIGVCEATNLVAITYTTGIWTPRGLPIEIRETFNENIRARFIAQRLREVREEETTKNLIVMP